MAKQKLFIPGISFLAGLILWIVFLIWGNPDTAGLQWVGSLFCLVIAGVFYYSAVQCRIATGGRKGNRVRSIILLLMATITYYQSALYGAIILVIAALVVLDMAHKGNDLLAGDTPPQEVQG